MSKPQRLASFCRLCLSKTKDKVPVFSDDNLLDGLLRLVEIEIDSKEESDAIVCYDCVVTLEGFHQFKEQCHVNDEFIKSLPPKIETSMSTVDSDDEDVEEEEEDGGGYVIDDIDEIDHLGPSEEEDELLVPMVPKKKQSVKASPKKGAKTSSSKVVMKAVQPEIKKSPPKGKKVPVKKQETQKVIVKATPEKKRRSMEPPLEKPQLAKSYPDFFHFEKGPRSLHYTLVLDGERFNTTLYHERNTTWQCIHRRKFQCPAQVWASHDYQHLERHNEHSHGPQLEKDGKFFTPQEALPDLFDICYNILMSRRKAKNEGYVNDAIEEMDSFVQSEEDESLEASSNKVAKKVVTIDTKKPLSKGSAVYVKKAIAEKITSQETNCISNKAPLEMPQLAESYPDFFYFEKTNQSTYYTMVYYGERYNSALFKERDSKWQCIHRRKYQCTAQLWVSHDFQHFERHNEHTHGKVQQKEGKIYTPLEALPELFQISYNMRMSSRILAQKVKNAIEAGKRGVPKRKHGQEDSVDSDAEETAGYEPGEYIPEEELQSRKKSSSKKQKKESPAGYEDLERIEAECEALNIPRKAQQGPPLEDMLVLADEYPDFFYFEKGPRSIYYSLIFYGERYHSASYSERYTYWPCQHRRKYKCPAIVAVTNDYKTFERRYEHTHGDIPLKEGVIYTPKEALPEMFNICRKMVYNSRARRRQKLLQKYKYLQSINEETKPMEFVETEDRSDGEDGVYEDEEILEDADED